MTDGTLEQVDGRWELTFVRRLAHAPEKVWRALSFRLEPDDGGCVLSLVDVFDDLGKAARDAAGWHTCLDVLEHHLAGEGPPWSQQDRWADVHPGYVGRSARRRRPSAPPAGTERRRPPGRRHQTGAHVRGR